MAPLLCYYCRSLPGETQDSSDAYTPHHLFQVACVACGCCGPIAPTEDGAVSKWNRLSRITAPT